jgi:hypothetical protein
MIKEGGEDSEDEIMVGSRRGGGVGRIEEENEEENEEEDEKNACRGRRGG